MANALYDKAREKFLGHTADLDWLADSIKAVLVDTAAGQYLVNTSSHEFLSDVPSSARRATSGNLASKTTNAPVGGVADAADVVFTAVPSGSAIGAIVIYKDTGTATNSPLIAYIDTAAGLPVTPNGGDITVVWDNGANRIFKL